MSYKNIYLASATSSRPLVSNLYSQYIYFSTFDHVRVQSVVQFAHLLQASGSNWTFRFLMAHLDTSRRLGQFHIMCLSSCFSASVLYDAMSHCPLYCSLFFVFLFHVVDDAERVLRKIEDSGKNTWTNFLVSTFNEKPFSWYCSDIELRSLQFRKEVAVSSG